jgi:hypothetical protein
MPIFLRARRQPHTAAFILPTEDLALTLASFLAERAWSVDFPATLPRMNPEECEVASILTREFLGSQSRLW